MQYADAFRKLGYDLVSPRQDWSADNADGVCISLWRKEMDKNSTLPRYDLWLLHPDPTIVTWNAKPGHGKRTRQLQRAISDFGGKVDVVLVSGAPGESYKDAEPWHPEKRGGSWRVTKFDAATGYFVAEVERHST